MMLWMNGALGFVPVEIRGKTKRPDGSGRFFVAYVVG
jgi:hypothetical protein